MSRRFNPNPMALSHGAYLDWLEAAALTDEQRDACDDYLAGYSERDYPAPTKAEVAQARGWRESKGEVVIPPRIDPPIDDAGNALPMPEWCETFICWHFSIDLPHLDWLCETGVLHPTQKKPPFTFDRRRLFYDMPRTNFPYPDARAMIEAADRASKRGILTIREAARAVGVTEKTIDRAMAQSKLPRLLFPGGAVRIDRVSLDTWARKRKASPQRKDVSE